MWAAPERAVALAKVGNGDLTLYEPGNNGLAMTEIDGQRGRRERRARPGRFGRGLSGHHFIGCALDAYMKGYRDFDAEKLYEGFKKLQTEETFISWRDVPQTSLDRVYLEKVLPARAP